MQFPIPSHLTGLLIPDEAESNENIVKGYLKCACGNNDFSFSYCGEKCDKYITTTEYNGTFVLAIRAKCGTCGKEILVFDYNRHGWDGFVCHEADIDPDELHFVPVTPCSCGENKMMVNITITNPGSENFAEEAGDDFDERDWVNAFDWITISLKCPKCGALVKDFIDMETM